MRIITPYITKADRATWGQAKIVVPCTTNTYALTQILARVHPTHKVQLQQAIMRKVGK